MNINTWLYKKLTPTEIKENEAAISGCTGNRFRVLLRTKKEALKKSRTSNLPTPPEFQEIIVLTYSEYFGGHDYEDMVNTARMQEKKDSDFSADKTYCHRISENQLLYKKNDSEQKYLRLYKGIHQPKVSKVKRFSSLSGREISEEEWKNLQREYFAISKSSNDKQELENPIEPMNIKIENIMYFSVISNQVINHVDKELLDALGLSVA